MKLKVIIFSITAFVIISVFALTSCFIFSPPETEPEEILPSYTEEESTTAEDTEATSAMEAETTIKDTNSDQIKVINPQPNQVIQSPLIITGEARGTWYFEATFPLKLMDANGNEIATHYAQAEGEWMTEDFVPFKAELIFEKPSTDTGILILEKNNPSGLPENDDSIEIFLKFNKSEKIIEDTDPQKGEYFVYAILKSIDIKNNKITVEQLINEPNEKEIFPEVTLSGDCKIIKVILERPDEKETVTEITLDSIQLGSEIGIIFKSDNTARAIIYQEIVEK